AAIWARVGVTVLLAVVQTSNGGTRQVVSAFGITNGDVPSALHRSWPIQARPTVVAPSGPAATFWTNCAQFSKPASVAVPGLLKRTISPLSKKPTYRSPSGLKAAPFGCVPVVGRGHPMPPRKVAFRPTAPPPRPKTVLGSSAPCPLSAEGSKPIRITPWLAPLLSAK